MDLFELLFIALFILFPVLEGILKQRKKNRGPGPRDEDAVGPGGRDREETVGEEEVRTASDMVPDDLWELMTGERRETPGEPVGVADDAESDSLWSTEPEDPGPAGAATGTSGDAPEWESEPWMDDSAASREPVSLEYRGPEAYSLETPAPPPLERRVPTAEARHRAFHELIDQPTGRRRRRRSPLGRALRSPDGLRQAVLLKEVLGPPKGLD